MIISYAMAETTEELIRQQIKNRAPQLPAVKAEGADYLDKWSAMRKGARAH